MTNFRYEVDQDGIALITWDMPGRSMNVLNADVLAELAALLDKTTADAAVKGVVVTTGKDTFSGGADLTVLQKLNSQFEQVRKSQGEDAAVQILFKESCKASVLYRKIETCGKPWACAINGTAAGGGFELALACHYRVASGLFPGAGGTTRIARILPPADALQYLLKGDLLRTDRAQKMKVIDAVVPTADLVKTAKDWIKGGGSAKKPWDMDGFRLPGGAVYSKAGMMTFPAANAIYRRETYDNYPAARAIMQVVYEGLLMPFDAAMRIEQRWFAKIVRSPQAAAMTRSLFVSMQALISKRLLIKFAASAAQRSAPLRPRRPTLRAVPRCRPAIQPKRSAFDVSRAAQRGVLLDPALKFGEAYMDGGVVVEAGVLQCLFLQKRPHRAWICIG